MTKSERHIAHVADRLAWHLAGGKPPTEFRQHEAREIVTEIVDAALAALVESMFDMAGRAQELEESTP